MNVIMNVSVEKKMDLANRKLELMCGELILWDSFRNERVHKKKENYVAVVEKNLGRE